MSQFRGKTFSQKRDKMRRRDILVTILFYLISLLGPVTATVEKKTLEMFWGKIPHGAIIHIFPFKLEIIIFSNIQYLLIKKLRVKQLLYNQEGKTHISVFLATHIH